MSELRQLSCPLLVKLYAVDDRPLDLVAPRELSFLSVAGTVLDLVGVPAHACALCLVVDRGTPQDIGQRPNPAQRGPPALTPRRPVDSTHVHAHLAVNQLVLEIVDPLTVQVPAEVFVVVLDVLDVDVVARLASVGAHHNRRSTHD